MISPVFVIPFVVVAPATSNVPSDDNAVVALMFLASNVPLVNSILPFVDV